MAVFVGMSPFVAECWSSGCSTTLEFTSHGGQYALHLSLWDVRLRGDICWILLPRDEEQVQVVVPDSLLDPEQLGVKMSHFAQPLALTDAYCSTAICPNSGRQGNAEVIEQRPYPQGYSRRSRCSHHLGFAGGQGYGGLSRTPATNHMLSKHNTSTARGFPCPQTARPVCVAISVVVV